MYLLYDIRNIPNIFKYKWNITFKNCESLLYICNLYNIVYHLYFNLKELEKNTS